VTGKYWEGEAAAVFILLAGEKKRIISSKILFFSPRHGLAM
jgi:hypothetical protein